MTIITRKDSMELFSNLPIISNLSAKNINAPEGIKSNNGLQLHRTDSTNLSYIYYKKTCGSVISPMGRIRRIARLDHELLIDFKNYTLSR